MKVNINNIKIFQIVAICLLLLSFSNCGGNLLDEAVWFRDKDGLFHTTDVKLAQEEIPFTIILPTFLPSDMGSDYPYVIIGPITNPWFDGVKIRISYIGEESTIVITEENNNLVMGPNDELEPVYLDIAGTIVLQQISYSHSISQTKKGLTYDWY